jgi:hypothetical protein
VPSPLPFVVIVLQPLGLEGLPDHRGQCERRHTGDEKRSFEPPCWLSIISQKYEPYVVKARAGIWTVPVFVLWHVTANHMTRKNESIMQNHFMKKWEFYFYSNHRTI